eukprot:TRINITY_DN8299_c0_g1_i1.p1 TRINITY_DN8299_c0_g1~~TRINITY_DN8299_c0_g1_i1.p1  ORF type:complete len:205 (+),score=78.20 TRINITY_DN8299_c0_g1_i1:83-697(+)
MSIMSHNGGAVIAMAGKNCVAIASDLRFGISIQTLACDFPKVFQMNERCFVGISGLTTDIQTVLAKLKFKWNMYKLNEEREMSPNVFANYFSTLLYEKRFGPYFTEPVIAGLNENNEPFLCSMDLIGASMTANDFVLAGTCNESLYGTCEAFWKPNLEPEELFETISQCLISSLDRDALCGWGAIVHVITPTEVISRKLKTRQD